MNCQSFFPHFLFVFVRLWVSENPMRQIKIKLTFFKWLCRNWTNRIEYISFQFLLFLFVLFVFLSSFCFESVIDSDKEYTIRTIVKLNWISVVGTHAHRIKLYNDYDENRDEDRVRKDKTNEYRTTLVTSKCSGIMKKEPWTDSVLLLKLI